MIIKPFKIRSSATYLIMAGTCGATAKQKETLAKLSDRKRDAENGIPGVRPLTANMETELAELKTLCAAPPELPAGAKTYAENWLKEQLYARRKEFTSKYTDKGNVKEQNSIDFACDRFGWGFATKNEEKFFNDFFEGTPDIVLAETVEDIKNSWDCFTFPLFDIEPPTVGYWWQLQSYMALTGKKRAGLIYTLMDAPDDIIEAEARKQAWKLYGSGEIPLALFDEVKAALCYEHLDPALRIRRFEFAYNNEAMLDAVERVKMIRTYINDVLLKKPAIIQLMQNLQIAA